MCCTKLLGIPEDDGGEARSRRRWRLGALFGARRNGNRVIVLGSVVQKLREAHLLHARAHACLVLGKHLVAHGRHIAL